MRNISETFMKAMLTEHLNPLLERVKSDPDLELFIRDGYINVYFKGASILKLTERTQGPTSRYLVEIAKPYSAPLAAFAKYGVPPLPGELNGVPEVEDFLRLLPLLKQGVLESSHRGKRELEFEQLFARINNRLGSSGVNTDYYIVDRQYAESGKSECRPDVLGIRWNTGGRKQGDTVAPVLIEVKYGLNPDIQDLPSQIRRYIEQLQATANWGRLICEMQSLLSQRAQLGVYGPTDSKYLRTLKIDERPVRAEVLILMVDYNRCSELYRRADAELAELASEKNLDIRVAHVGTALWHTNTSRVGNEAMPAPVNQGFKSELYAHLIDMKARHITAESGARRNGSLHPMILPLEVRDQLPHIYAPIRDLVKTLTFKQHEYFHHMASSQAACLNMFLPILSHPKAEEVLRAALPDIQSIDRTWLGHGFSVEYSGEELGMPGGPIGDKTVMAGTDCDLAVAYTDKAGRRCLWLVEHKLTEQEFTTCGGYNSKGRDPERHLCESSFEELLHEPHRCYYQEAKKYLYWQVTEANRASFAGAAKHIGCPFKEGMNQLWRNLLMAWAIKEISDFDHVTFSVVHHPNNTDILPTIRQFQSLLDPQAGFSAFDSKRLLDAARQAQDPDLLAWVDWYEEQYLLRASHT